MTDTPIQCERCPHRGHCRGGQEPEIIYNRRWSWPWLTVAMWDWHRRMALPATGRARVIEGPAPRPVRSADLEPWTLHQLVWRAINRELREAIALRPAPNGHATVGVGSLAVLPDPDSDGSWGNLVMAYEDW
ncbi:MAG: hypothetical protein PHU85_03155 [Phycisphaerae bacterium]|nr:hypothetical protein [Phycisphaerae bacterium]